MSEHNSRDCAALVSLTVEKQLAAKYRDIQCLLPVEEIQVLKVEPESFELLERSISIGWPPKCHLKWRTKSQTEG